MSKLPYLLVDSNKPYYITPKPYYVTTKLNLPIT